jgi:hypothetical protein
LFHKMPHRNLRPGPIPSRFPETGFAFLQVSLRPPSQLGLIISQPISLMPFSLPPGRCPDRAGVFSSQPFLFSVPFSKIALFSQGSRSHRWISQPIFSWPFVGCLTAVEVFPFSCHPFRSRLDADDNLSDPDSVSNGLFRTDPPGFCFVRKSRYFSVLS